MKIQIDGTNTLNKGAELMLYAILEEIEKRVPNAEVIYNCNNNSNDDEIKTTLKLHRRLALTYSRFPVAILKRLHLPHTFFTSKYAQRGVSLVLDGAGFQFSDQWRYSDGRLAELESYYKKLKEYGSKIVLLPQAFGPFETPNGKRAVEIINRYVDVVVAREEVSYNYLRDAGLDSNKLFLYPDFTILVKGEVPNSLASLKDQVCLIPNNKMITHTDSSQNDYLVFLEKVIKEINSHGKSVFLLNHEGPGDLEVCKTVNKLFGDKMTIVTGLNAKEIKGVIGSSYLVISSRFHGVASALNQCVPCLATSWNHKYKMLFSDFGQYNNILPVAGQWTQSKEMIDTVFQNHHEIKEQLAVKKREIADLTGKMWDMIWS